MRRIAAGAAGTAGALASTFTAALFAATLLLLAFPAPAKAQTTAGIAVDTDLDMSGRQNASNIDEGERAEYTVVLTSQPTAPVTITPLSDTPGSLRIESASLTFTTGNWNTAQTVLVSALDDDRVVHLGSFFGVVERTNVDITHRAVSTDSNYNKTFSTPTARLVVVEDDMIGLRVDTDPDRGGSQDELFVNEGATATYTVVLTSQPSGSVTLRPSSSDSAATVLVDGRTAAVFTTDNWDIPQAVTVTVGQDADALDEAAAITHTGQSADSGYNENFSQPAVQVTVRDDETADVRVDTDPDMDGAQSALTVVEGATATYTVVLTSLPGDSVTVTPASGATGKATVSTARMNNTLLFTTDNWNMPQTVTVSGVADDSDFNNETVTVTHEAASDDDTYAFLATFLPEVTVTVDDDDTPTMPTLQFVSASAMVAEGGTLTLALELMPALTVNSSVAVAATAGTATAADYTAPPATLALAANTTSFSLELVTLDDRIADDFENLTVTLTAVSSAPYTLGTQSSVAVTITDDDAIGVAVDTDPDMDGSQTVLAVAEGAMAEYTMVLTSQPADDITITPGAASSKVALSGLNASGALVFGTGDWSTPQTVTVTAPSDDDASDETDIITHAVDAGSDINFGAAIALEGVPAIVVSVSDDDTAGVLVDTDPDMDGAQTALAVTEGDMAEYTVVLTSQPAGSVTVGALIGGNAKVRLGGLTAGALTFTTDNWNAAQTVTVTGLEDVNTMDEMVTVRHPVGSADDAVYDRATAADVTVAVTDDDAVTLQFSEASASVTEGGTVTLTLELSRALTVASSVGVAVDVGGAHTAAAADFTALGFATLSLPTAATTVTLTLATVQESLGEADETLAVNLSVPMGVTAWQLGARASITVTITDDDVGMYFVSQHDDANSPATSVSVWPEPNTEIYHIGLRGQPTAPVTVTVTSDDTSAITAAPGTLTFSTSAWNTVLSLTLRVVEDPDAKDETGITISYGVTSTDTLWNGLSIVDGIRGVGDPLITVTTRDNDTASVVVDTDPDMDGSQTALAVSEQAAAAEYTLVLTSQPANPVTVTVTSADTSAVTAAPGTLTFSTSAWNTPQPVTVTAVDDADALGETVSLSHTTTSSDSDYNGATVSPVAVTVTDNDSVGVVVDTDPDMDGAQTTLSVTEEAAAVEYTLVLSSQPANPVTVSVTNPDTSALSLGGLTSGALTFSTANWSTPQPVTVTAINDTDMDAETVTLSHTATSTDTTYNGATVSPVTVTVTDNDLPTVQFSSATATVAEGSAVTLSLELSSGLMAASSVGVAVDVASPNTADAMDFTPLSSATVALPASSTTVTLVLSTVNDSLAEGDETLMVELSRPTSVTAWTPGTQYSITVTITDDDMEGVSVLNRNNDNSAVRSPVLTEGDTLEYRLVLTSQPANPVTVTVTSSDTSALTVFPSSLTFIVSNWNMVQTLTMSAVEDTDSQEEPGIAVSFMVTSTDTAYNSVAVDPFSITARDNDVPQSATMAADMAPAEGGGMVTLTATLDRAVPADQTGETLELTLMGRAMDGGVDYTLSDTAFRFSSGDTEATLTLSVVDDDIVEGNEDIVLGVSSALLIRNRPVLTLTITDNDRAGVVVDTDPDMDGAQTALAVTEEGAAGEYTLVLSSQPANPVTVTVTNSDSSAVGLGGLAAGGTLTFSTANWSTPQPVTVSAMNDANTVNETVTLGHTTSSTDPNYNTITVSSVTVTVTDNDIPALAFSAASYSVQETGGNVATLTVTISPQLAAPSSVTVQVSGGTATQNTDYSLSTTTLSLPAGMGMATFTVTGLADMTTEGDETVALELAAVSGAPYNLGAQRTTEVTIMDNSLTPPGVVPSVSALTVAEGATASYTLVLRAPPAAAVTVTPTSSDTGAVTVSAALMFTTDNWDSAQTVTVSAVQNEEAGDVTVTIGHAAVSTDSGYDGISIAPVAVTVQDDEGAPLDEVSQALVPELSRVLADSTVGAVAQRIARIVDEQAGAGAAGAALGGQSSLDALVRAHAPALSEGQLTLAGLLDGSAFVLPLQGITGPEDPSWLSDLTLWGGGQYRKFSDKGGEGRGLDWEGDAFTAQLGLDARLRGPRGGDLLVGVAGAWSRGVVDYRRLDAGGAGSQEYRLTLGSVLPYLSWTPGPRVNLWLSGGYGQGAVRLSQPAGAAVNSDMSQRLVAGGGNVRLVERGRASLHLRLEGQGVWTAVDGSRGGELSAHDVQTRTVRALLRGSNTVVLSGGGSLAPVLELGARHDGGDGDTGASAQLGGELRYRSARGGLQAEGGGQWLLGRDRYREWGVWGLVSWADGPDGRGWSLRLRPRYGLGGSGGSGSGLGDVERLWERGGLAGALSAPSASAVSAVPSGQLDLRLGYGLARGLGLFAPYSELSLAEASRRWRLGVQWRLGEWWDVDLVGERLERTGAGAAAGQGRNPEHRLLLEGRIRY